MEDFNKLYDEIQDVTNRTIMYAGWEQMNGNSQNLLQKVKDAATTLSNAAHLLHEEMAWGDNDKVGAENYWDNVTSFYGETINANFNTLVEAFGEPEAYYDSDKVQVEWEIKIPEMNTTIYLYDWKEYAINVRKADEIEWHIGRKNKINTEELYAFFAARGLQVKKS